MMMEQLHPRTNPDTRTLHAPPAQGESEVVAYRVLELETDRLRLQRLVTELLIKNQHLRATLDRLTGPSGTSDALSALDEQWS